MHNVLFVKKLVMTQPNNYVAKWKYFVLVAGVLSSFIDFCFIYTPKVSKPNSIHTDWQLGAYIAIARSTLDLIFLSGMIFKLRTSYTPPNFSVFERQLRQNMKPKYSKSSLLVDLMALLPLPQVSLAFKVDRLFLCVWAQLPFRVVSMSLYPQRTAKTMGVLVKNAWLGALQNLFYFLIISNGVGAFFYDEYIVWLKLCRSTVIQNDKGASALDWDELLIQCTQNYNFEYGIFSEAFSNKIGTRTFSQRYTYCLAWGLKSLSSFGQIFSASSFTVDTVFSLLIVIFGLILFGDLLAKMQTALQCTEVKEDRQRTKQRTVDEWIKYHQLPQPLKKQVKQAIQAEWSNTRGITDEAILDSLPWDIRSNIRRHLYREIIGTMPIFKGIDDDLVNAICGYLRTYSSNEGTYIVFKGEPVHQMLFVFRGELEVSNANNGGKCITLGPRDLCGKELLEWCSHPTTSTEKLKPATQTIKCLTDVDAFSLRDVDVKLLAIQFHRDGKFRRAFQSYAE